MTPLVRVIPNEAAVPALILVGFLMMQQVQNIEWDDVEIAIPAFLTIILMPFTYSITVGIGAGFLSFVFIKVVMGKWRSVHAIMWLVAGPVRRLLPHRPAHRPGDRLTSSAAAHRPAPARPHHHGCRAAPSAGEARHPRVVPAFIDFVRLARGSDPGQGCENRG